MKRRRLTGAEFKEARKTARDVTGYDDTSPIWGKRMPAVLVEIGERIEKAHDQMNLGSYANAHDHLNAANLLVTELKKRIATGQIIGSAR